MSNDQDVHRLNRELENVVNGFFEGEFENCPREEFERRLDVVMKSAISMLASTQASFIKVHGPQHASNLMQLTMVNLTRLVGNHLSGAMPPPPDAEPEAASEKKAPKKHLH